MQYVVDAARAFSETYEREFVNLLDGLVGVDKGDELAHDSARYQANEILTEWQSAMSQLQDAFQPQLAGEQPSASRIHFLQQELEHVCATGRRHYWQRGAA